MWFLGYYIDDVVLKKIIDEKEIDTTNLTEGFIFGKISDNGYESKIYKNGSFVSVIKDKEKSIEKMMIRDRIVKKSSDLKFDKNYYLVTCNYLDFDKNNILKLDSTIIIDIEEGEIKKNA